MDDDIAVVVCKQTGCLITAHIIISIDTADVFIFTLYCDYGDSKLCQFL